MSDEINFLDLITLSRITPDLVVEKFGSKINSSYFDAANILGTLRIKGLIGFSADFPGQNAITVTDVGKALMKEAEDRSKGPFDQIDFAILLQMKSGKRSYVDIGNAVNLRPKDLAMHLYKLGKQQYAVEEIRNGLVEVMLTEKGLNQANAGMPKPQPLPGQTVQTMQAQQPQQQTKQPQQMKQSQAMAQAQSSMPMQGQNGATPPAPDNGSMGELEKALGTGKAKAGKTKIIAVVVVIIIIVFIVLYVKHII